MARPDAVLFNGGFFTPSLARNQVLDALAAWFGARPRVLENENPEAAVALGAAFYGKLRQDAAAARRLLIRAGSARSYYIGVAAEDGARRAVCVIPRGTEEGTRFELDREFTVLSNQPAAFTLYSSIDRADAVGTVIDRRRRPGRAASRAARDRFPLRQALAQGAAGGTALRRLHGNGHAGALVPRRRHRPSLAAGVQPARRRSRPARRRARRRAETTGR